MAIEKFGEVSKPKVDLKLKVEKEIGSGFDYDDMMFAGWDGGAVYEYQMAESRDFEQMLEKDGKAENLYRVLTLPIRSAEWSIKPGPDDQGQAEWIQDFLCRPANQHGMGVPFEIVIAQALSARLYRKAFFEKIFCLTPDGKIGYKKLAWRPPATCGIRRDPETGSFRGFQQRPLRPGITHNIMPINFEPQYSWVHINGQDRDPIRGYSDMQIPYWNHITKLKIMFLWHTFLETQATPRTTVTGKDPAAAQENAKKVAKLKNGGVVGLPDGIETHTLESNGTGARYFQEAIAWLDSQSSQAMLAGFTDLASAAGSGRGSYALSKDQSDFFLKSLQSTARELAQSVSNYVLPDLVLYNWGPDASVPTFDFSPLSEKDLEPLTTLIQTLAVAPQMNTPYDFLGELVQKTAGFLNLDEAKIEEALVKGGKQYQELADSKNEAAKKMADMAGQVGTANALVKGAQEKDAKPGQPKPPVPAAQPPAAQQ